jgi:general secretion pathway protein D
MKNQRPIFRLLKLFSLAILFACLASCGAERLAREGRALIEEGRVEEGLQKLRQAAKEDPRDLSHRTALAQNRERAIFEMLSAADQDLAGGRDAEAEGGYQRALALSPNNPRALAGLEAVIRLKRNRADVQRAINADAKGQVETALDLLQRVLAENPDLREAREARREIQTRRFRQLIASPQIRSRYTKPISLEFREAALRQVFDALSKGSGLNFIFDKDVRPDIRISISVKDVLIENAIDLLLDPNQLTSKVLNENTLLIYPATAAKIREYQDMVIRSFYLENADVKQTQNMVKTMLKVKDTFIDEKLNLLVIRDTPDVIKLAEHLISVQDQAEPEVVLEIEVMEILRSRLSQLGITFPNQWQLNSRGITGTPLPGTLDLRSERGESNLLSNPRIRVRNREKARVLIGNRIPVISSVVTPNVASPVITDNIQYLDVGLKLEAEPSIHMDGGVMIKMSLEVSTLGDQVVSKNGTVAFRVGTRTAATVLQLKDGETQTLMGLIQDDEIERASRIPGLGDVPVLGRLFSNNRNDAQKTEIVLSITPRIVRNIVRPPLEAAALWSGTEAGFRSSRPMLQPVEAPVKPAAVNNPAPATSQVAPTATPATQDTFEIAWKGPSQVAPGEEFTVLVEGTTVAPLSAAELQLLFDPSMLAVVRVSEGDWLRSQGAQTVFEDRSILPAGRIITTTRRAGATGASGAGALLSITLRAVGRQGPTQLFVTSAVPSRAGGGALPVRGSGPLQIRIAGAGAQ